MNRNVEEICERLKTRTENEARKEVCETRIEVVDDVEHEKSEEQRNQDEEDEFRTRNDAYFVSLLVQTLQQGKEREEDCRKATAEERRVPEIHVDYMFMGDEKEGENGFFDGKRRSDKSCAQHRSSRTSSRTGPRALRFSLCRERPEQHATRLKTNGEERRGGEDGCDSVWPWIAEQVGFHLTRFDVGIDRKTTYERLKRKSAKVPGLSLAEGLLWEEETTRRLAWKVDVHVGGWRVFGQQGNHGRSHSSWGTEMAFGSQEWSGGRHRGKDGNEATWR